MSCTIRINNKVGVKGEISALTKAEQATTPNESLDSWLSANPSSDVSEYHRNFSYVTVLDKEISDLLYLVEPLIVDSVPVGNKCYFVEPETESEIWIELFQTGKIALEWSTVALYIRGRS